jgi:zinc transport system ATP-binding protein
MIRITEAGDFDHVFSVVEAIDFNQSAAMRDDERILTVNDLTVRFANRTAIQSLTFNVVAGETLAIIGPNGAGKTVLLRTLLGMVPYEGQITWANDARIGYVPQRISADRELPLQLCDLLNAKARFLKRPMADVDTAATSVGLSAELLKTSIGLLSGGQFQKALIAFALVGQPNVILFDEPTTSLDELTEERIYELIQDLKHERGLTILLISHDLSVVYRYATTVLCLNKAGVCFGTPTDVLTPEAIEALYSAPHKYFQHLREHDAMTPGQSR